MIAVSDAWKIKQQAFLAPEGFLEISCTITEVGAQDEIIPSGTNEAIFSDISGVAGTSGEQTTKKYATLEPNLWALDGTRNIVPTEQPYANIGYVSNIAETGSVTLALPGVHSTPIPGVTITWSSEYEEYPHVFTVTAKNGDTVVAETTITDNTKVISVVYMDIVNYDSITVTVHNWNIPNRRARIDLVKLGLDLTFTKSDITGYTHEQFGSTISGELSKNSIEFSVDNTDNRWNPNNPGGMEQYLSERQQLTVKYGFDIDGTTEWIKAGTFYLSEWRAPSNGVEASFAARDIFEYLLGESYTGRREGTLEQLVLAAFSSAGLPDAFRYDLHSALSLSPTITLKEGTEYTCAEVVQMCANAANLVMYQDRDGILHLTELDETPSGYVIPSSLAYTHPEVELSKQLKNVSVSYTDSEGNALSYALNVGTSGETQTVNNPFVVGEEAAASMANWVSRNLISRKTVSGEYRADPRIDLFDVVTVESKFGSFSPVVITDIKYSFTGSFKASYTGRVIA